MTTYYHYLKSDPDKTPIYGIASTTIVNSLKQPWHGDKSNRQYMKDFRLRAINIYGKSCDRIRINSCKNFISDLIALEILIPVNHPMSSTP